MTENEKITEVSAADTGADLPPKKKNPQIVMTIGVSIALAAMFVLDLVLFLLNMLEWYIFIALLAMYLIVFPLALLIIFRSRKSVNEKEVRAEVEADLLKAADAPDPTRVYEE